MKLRERLQLLKAGYSRSEIEEFIRAEETPESTNSDNSENQASSQEEEATDNPETESGTPEHSNISNELESELLATIEELQAQIKDLQRENLKNSTQPEVENKPPIESASDILFNKVLNGGKI